MTESSHAPTGVASVIVANRQHAFARICGRMVFYAGCWPASQPNHHNSTGDTILAATPVVVVRKVRKKARSLAGLPLGNRGRGRLNVYQGGVRIRSQDEILQRCGLKV